jgi:hypothetical protein
MNFNDFYVKSLEAGAQPDPFGNIQHTTASMQTFVNNQDFEQQRRFAQELESKPLGFWQSLFG